MEERNAETVLQVRKSGRIEFEAGACLACRECEVACSLYHEGICSPSLSRIRLSFNDFEPGLPSVALCKQCDWPACFFACADLWDDPAISIDPATGARVINPDRCRGCGACERACPLAPERDVIVSKVEGRTRTYIKCDLCYDRAGGPVCVEICPGDALTYVPAKNGRGRKDA